MEDHRTAQEIASDKLNECKKELAREQELRGAYANVLAGVLYINSLLEEKVLKAGRQ
jgi:hypothetical protein